MMMPTSGCIGTPGGLPLIYIPESPMPEHTPRIENAPYLSLRHGGLTVEGWSRAGIQSYWRIPELRIGFDLGAIPWDFTPVGTWFVTHGHIDHLLALPGLVARRGMLKYPPPIVHVPAEIVGRRAQPVDRLAGPRRRPTAMRGDRPEPRRPGRASSDRAFRDRVRDSPPGPEPGVRRVGAAAQAQAGVRRPGRPRS